MSFDLKAMINSELSADEIGYFGGHFIGNAL